MHIPPRPYLSGMLAHYASHIFTIRMIPPQEEAEKMEFQEAIQKGFEMALRSGVDEMASISSVMVKVGERMTEQAQGIRFSPAMLQPQLLFTLGRAWLRSKMEKRPMLPKDIWRPKGIIAGGTDTSIYKNDVAHYWGKIPFEMYGATEAVGLGVQNWNKKWLTFIPFFAFLEFIPEDESIKLREDTNYQPKTLLLNEVEEGKIYELLITNFYGMPLIRYRLRDLIQIVALSDDETGVVLPQFVFHARVGETVDLAGLARLTERVIWQAIANTEVKFEDWSACKEYNQNKTYIRVYIELKEERQASELERLIDEQLKAVDLDYRDVSKYLDMQPVMVRLLSPGTFDHYYQEKVSEGADMAHLKPPHINASDKEIQLLLKLSG